MKGFASFFLLAAAGILALGGKSPTAPSPAAASIFPPQLDAALLKCDNPLCDCQSCECVTCTCTPLADVGKLVAGENRPSNDVSRLGITQLCPGEFEEKFTEPQPAKIIPIAHPAPKPVAKSPPAVSGHWETRYAGFRGRRSYQVWVSDSAACANAACAAPAPQATYFSGGCANGRCGR